MKKMVMTLSLLASSPLVLNAVDEVRDFNIIEAMKAAEADLEKVPCSFEDCVREHFTPLHFGSKKGKHIGVLEYVPENSSIACVKVTEKEAPTRCGTEARYKSCDPDYVDHIFVAINYDKMMERVRQSYCDAHKDDITGEVNSDQ